MIGNIPKKILFGNFKQEKLVRRKMQLQIFLGRIVMVDHPDVKSFLQANNHVGEQNPHPKHEIEEQHNLTNVDGDHNAAQ